MRYRIHTNREIMLFVNEEGTVKFDEEETHITVA